MPKYNIIGFDTIMPNKVPELINISTPKAEELIKQVIIHPPKLAPLLFPVLPATMAATNGVTINPMV